MRQILLISENKHHFKNILKYQKDRFLIDYIDSFTLSIDMFKSKRYDFTILDLSIIKPLLKNDKIEAYADILNPFWNHFPNADIIIASKINEVRSAVQAVRAGASNYITFPFVEEEFNLILDLIENEKIKNAELNYLRDITNPSENLDIVMSKNPKMLKIFNQIQRVAPTKSTVLITGETGTGKGVVASLLHKHSERHNKPFISIQCSAIPETLLESELFGHEKGAFTGASSRKIGKFEIAKDGTVFLDEIGTISENIQIKLLKIIQEKKFRRLGGTEEISTDIRFISATNESLKKMVDEGRFRRDLYYRLNVFPINLPDLIERKEDIELFAKYFLNKLNKEYNKNILKIDTKALSVLNSYDWPGNVRELENIIERAYILEESSRLTLQSLPEDIVSINIPVSSISVEPLKSLSETRKFAINEIEKSYLKEVLSKNFGKISKSAKDSGISTRQLHKLMIKYNLKKERFKLSKEEQ